MRSKDFILETVTSYVVRGAENHEGSMPELRAPSFRGIMRYWFRSVAGGIIRDLNIAEIQKLETLVFGDTESGSPVKVQVLQKQLAKSRTELLPHHHQAVRNGFSANQEFVVKLSETRPINDLIWEAAVTSLELAVSLGGIGVRSRRGYGALRFKNNPQFSGTNDWKEEIEDVVKRSIEVVKKLAIMNNITIAPLPNSPSAFPSINKEGVIQLGNKGYTSGLEGLTAFMAHVQEVDWIGFVHKHPTERQASPLWVKPVKIGDLFFLQYVVLASSFKESNYPDLNSFLEKDRALNLEIGGWNA